MDPTIQQAVQDLALIRRAIEQGDRRSEGPRPGPAIRANLALQGIGLFFSSFLIAFELLTDSSMSIDLMISRYDREIGVEGMTEVALCLPFLVAALYFIVWRSAKHADRDLPDFLARNFQYLRNLNFLSDLFVKFVVLALAVLSSHGEWIPALLLLFMGDYLLQGRFFTLPLMVTMLLGPLCFAGAGILYLRESMNLLWPLIVFDLLCALSMAFTWQKGRAK